MKKLKTNNIASNVAQPIKKGSLDHLQQSYAEALDALGRSIVGSYDASKIYVLYGCVNTGSGLNYIISAGAVFFNGEVFLVDAATFTSPGGQVAVGTVTETYVLAASADPVLFTDGSTNNVHLVRKVVIASGVSGSGTGDYGGWLPIGTWHLSTSTGGTFSGSSGTVISCWLNWVVGSGTVTLNYDFFINVTTSASTIALLFPLPSPSRVPAGIPTVAASSIMLKVDGTYAPGLSAITTIFGNDKLNVNFTAAPGVGNIQFFGQIIYEI